MTGLETAENGWRERVPLAHTTAAGDHTRPSTPTPDNYYCTYNFYNVVYPATGSQSPRITCQQSQ